MEIKKKCLLLLFQGKGEVTADMYSYLEGTPPQNNGEVAISYIVADNIGAEIGDDVNIQIGEEVKNLHCNCYQSVHEQSG